MPHTHLAEHCLLVGARPNFERAPPNLDRIRQILDDVDQHLPNMLVGLWLRRARAFVRSRSEVAMASGAADPLALPAGKPVSYADFTVGRSALGESLSVLGKLGESRARQGALTAKRLYPDTSGKSKGRGISNVRRSGVTLRPRPHGVPSSCAILAMHWLVRHADFSRRRWRMSLSTGSSVKSGMRAP